VLADQPERRHLPERAAAAVAERDRVVGGQAEQLGQATADPLDQRPDRRLAV